jgi:hypothetical protein
VTAKGDWRGAHLIMIMLRALKRQKPQSSTPLHTQHKVRPRRANFAALPVNAALPDQT